MVLTFSLFNLNTRNFTIFPKIYLLRNAVGLLRRHRLSIIGQNLLASKKINSGDACQNTKTLDQLCNPCGPTMLPPPPRETTTKCQKLCYPYSHRMRLFLFRHKSIGNIIFMLQIVTNMNETLIILHLQRMAGI